jgi:sulfite exporter TauE/SafE
LPFLNDLFRLKFFPELGRDASFGLLFVLGVLTSFHCIGMCGGIAISQAIRNGTSGEENGRRAWLVPSMLYNAGRVIAYTVVGGIVGGLGQAISFSGVWKGIVPIFGGVFMIIMGINLLGIFPFFRRLNLRMPYFAAKKIQGKNNYGPFFIGLLSGLMPCGPLQIVQLYALGTRSAIFGALSMFAFSLGTVPVLFAFGALNSFINKKHAGRILKVSAVLVIILGVAMIGRGLALSGVWIRMPENVSAVEFGIARIDGNIQTVATSIQSGGYPPIVVQKGIPVRWIIKADADNLNGCNNAITIPRYNIDKKLVEGLNVVEFTPWEEGDVAYSCWMGMIKSKITVVSDIAKLSHNQ